MRRSGRDFRAELPQRRDVIQDPERPPVSSDDHIVMMNDQIADRSRRQIHLQRLPVVAVVPRHIHAAFGAGEKQSLALGIFPHRVDGLVLGQSSDDLLPRLSAVVRAIDIRMQVIEPETIHRGIGSCGIEM